MTAGIETRNTIKYQECNNRNVSTYESVEHHITAEFGNWISSGIALSRNIEEIHMAVLGITEYELVTVPEFPRTVRYISPLTHWGRVTHKCVSKLTTIGSDNGFSPGRGQAIIKTNASMLLIWHLGTNVSEILIEINTYSFKKMQLKMSSGKWRPYVSASMC